MVQAVVIQGANCTIAKGQEEYLTLYGRRETVPLGPGQYESFKVEAVSVAFHLELPEIQALLAGGSLIVRQLTFGKPYTPISLWVEPAAEPLDMAAAIKPAG